MKILHISDLDGLSNGITTVVKELSAAQIKDGHEVLAINTRDNSIEIEGIINEPNLSNIKNIVLSFKPEIVVVHGLFFRKIKEATHLFYRMNIPYVIVPHAAFSKINYSKNKIKKWLFYRLYLYNAIDHSLGWIFLNQNEKHEFCLPIRRSYILPNGCHPNLIEKKNHNKTCFVYIGRIDFFHKGIDLLLDGIDLFSQNNPTDNINISFYGTGPEKDIKTLRERIKPYPWISYNGPIFGSEKVKVLRDADIVILTSRYEGFPMIILEGWGYGTPCMVSESTNIAEIVRKYDCGWVLRKLDAKSISDSLSLSATQYRERPYFYQSNAFKTAQNYSWEIIARESVKIYSQFLK